MCQTSLVLVVAVVSCLWTTVQGSTPIRRCTDDIPSPHSVQINDCEAYPCALSAGSTANMTIQFHAVHNQTENIHAEVVAYINGDAIPFGLPDDFGDVCKHLNSSTKCPLQAGDNATYTLSLPLDTNIPELFVAVEVALVDESKTCISCFVSDIRVKAQRHHPDNDSK